MRSPPSALYIIVSSSSDPRALRPSSRSAMPGLCGGSPARGHLPACGCRASSSRGAHLLPPRARRALMRGFSARLQRRQTKSADLRCQRLAEAARRAHAGEHSDAGDPRPWCAAPPPCCGLRKRRRRACGSSSPKRPRVSEFCGKKPPVVIVKTADFGFAPSRFF